MMKKTVLAVVPISLLGGLETSALHTAASMLNLKEI